MPRKKKVAIVEEDNNLVRDLSTNAIINTNETAYERRLEQIQRKQSQEEIDAAQRADIEELKADMERLLNEINAPREMRKVAANMKNQSDEEILSSVTKTEILIANRIYEKDFDTFGYPKIGISPSKKHLITDSASIRILELADKVKWHWGPTAQKKESKLNQTREK